MNTIILLYNINYFNWQTNLIMKINKGIYNFRGGSSSKQDGVLSKGEHHSNKALDQDLMITEEN